jgi:hypothetical protein
MNPGKSIVIDCRESDSMSCSVLKRFAVPVPIQNLAGSLIDNRSWNSRPNRADGFMRCLKYSLSDASGPSIGSSDRKGPCDIGPEIPNQIERC